MHLISGRGATHFYFATISNLGYVSSPVCEDTAKFTTENFQMKSCVTFLIFTKSIYCWYIAR